MPAYRIYTIGRYGHFSSAEDIECADDQEAIQKAQQAVSVCDVELWERRRLIARLPSKPTRSRRTNTILPLNQGPALPFPFAKSVT
jgi:hypothetical protein